MTLVHIDNVDKAAVLTTLGLNPNDPHTHALLLICQRYDLDPLLKHIVLIKGRPYITRDGYLAVAHASGQFDGIEIVDEGEDRTHWWAKAAVYRKDMSRPFTYRGRYPKDGQQARYGPEMAVKTAEVMAMRRAFNVTGLGAADEAWDSGDTATTAVELMIPARDAKSQLLDAAGGDKDAAARAWDNAGLGGRREVTADELADAIHHLTALTTGDDEPVDVEGQAVAEPADPEPDQ